MKSAVLVACLSPIAIIWIVMKLVLWLSETNKEHTYVSAEKYRKRGPYLEGVYDDVDEEEEEYGSRTDYR